MDEIDKAYNPSKVEQRLYDFWLRGDYFKPKIDKSKKPFTIIMPPPNVTGELHLGHALTATYEDILVRWHRMLGDPTLWLPGVDHAGIATQYVVEQQLLKEGLDRHKLGREKFIARVWEWVNNSRKTITLQHQRLGASADWSRECFTLDEKPAHAVKTAFVNLYRKGLIYRGERIINWCPRCQTALSDLEVQHKDINGNLYYINYPLKDETGFITVATTRPETYLGDTAVAVNPDDLRYKNLIGKYVLLPIINRPIPIISDNDVDSSFGTGMVKITPAHDPVDFEISRRHSLPLINIFNPDASLNENGGPYKHLDRFMARNRIVEDLKGLQLLEKIEPHLHAVGHCDRCQTMVEPWVSKQWFIKIDPLARRAIEVVKNGRIKIIPERFIKIYLNWMENIRDWCISRQLWWGHQIPVWYCHDCNETIVSVNTPERCTRCNSRNLIQETDVLDTWFSSALWTHSTLGWPDKTEDLEYFYPTTVMVTGYDILFFWVARMIMMGLENMNDIPFEIVYLNGLIRDEKGNKMSKVRGNVINPLSVIDKFGTDALRFALTTGTAPGNDVNIGEGKFEAGRNFCNKLWNASRFVLQSIAKSPVTIESLSEISTGCNPINLPLEDRWILSRIEKTTRIVLDDMNKFLFSEAQREIYDFIWNEYCDWYIEFAKLRITRKELTPIPVLVYVLEKALRLLHPFMPFITEEIWQNIKKLIPEMNNDIPSIMIAPYPTYRAELFDEIAEDYLLSIIEVTRSIRNIRAEYKVNATKWIEVNLYAEEYKPIFEMKKEFIKTLSHSNPLNIFPRNQRQTASQKAVVYVLKCGEIVVPLANMIDLESERVRLSQEIEQIQKDITRLSTRLSDMNFLNKAPQSVIEKEKEKLQIKRDRLNRLQQELAQLT